MQGVWLGARALPCSQDWLVMVQGPLPSEMNLAPLETCACSELTKPSTPLWGGDPWFLAMVG